jgi:beta-N-acetylhexosaminidase
MARRACLGGCPWAVANCRSWALVGAVILVLELTASACGAPSPSPSSGQPFSGPQPSAGPHVFPTSFGIGTPAPPGVCSLPPVRFQVAQLLLVPVPGTEINSTSLAIVHSGVGGILLSGPNIQSATQVRALIGALQREAEVPLALAVDEEPGRIARFAQAGVLPQTPSARALAEKPPADVRAAAKKIGSGLGDLGVTVDLAPVLDVMTGAAADSVIGDRSFGESPAVVSRAGVAFVQGLRDAGVAAVAKHFPGHGETVVDSHFDLPVVPTSLPELSKRALAPFAAAIKVNVPAIMVGHLLVRAVDPYLPATLSSRVIGGLLRSELGFGNLVVADALDMGAIAARWDLPVAVEKAIAAGVDLAILSGDTRVVETIDHLEAAASDGRLPAERVRQAFLRVESFKGVDRWAACR